MKKRFFPKFPPAIIFLLLFLTANLTVFSQSSKIFSINESPLPDPTGYVNDFADVIEPATERRIEEKITEFNKSSNPPVELAVAVVRNTEGRPIFEYSLAVARGWGIGSKNDDNPGALLFVAVDDRKYFTQISRNLEDELPDGLAGSLQRRYLIPEFKKGNYGKGIEDTIDAYIRTIREKQSGERVSVEEQEETPGETFTERRSSGGSTICGTFICLLVLIVVLFIIFASIGGNNNRRGGGGGGGSEIAGAVGNALLWAVISGIANSGSGSSGSSNWGGGGSSGGWGGFGGGGDFGGGGAGGSW